MNFRISILFTIAILGFAFTAQAQITVDNTISAEELVLDYLIGDGVDVENITFNGQPGNEVNVQIGLYQGTSDVVSFEEGIVMGTYNVEGVETGIGGAATNPADEDPDLVDIAGFNINDGAILEFDFLATSDSIKFNYVFASNEYPSYTCTQFNDAFGFFLSGPGINGPYTDNAENIALIPGTDIPVAINTVNGGSPTGSGTAENCEEANPNWVEDSQYFVDNGAQPAGDVQFPGMTVTLTAEADVDCGEWYHIKLAIGDAVDGALDSGVFLEAGSFAAFGDVIVDVSPTIGGAPVIEPEYEDVLVAGCSEATFDIIRPTGVPVGEVTVEFSGTAVEDQDYIFTADPTFVFPDGVDTLTFSIETLWDGVPDENETLIITIFYPDGCGEIQSSSATIDFVDPYELETETEDVDVICPADQVQVTAEGSNGIGPYDYDWGEFGMAQTTVVPVPEDEAYYVVGVSDQCGFEVALDSVLVTNSIPPPLQSAIDFFPTPTCPNETVELDALVSDGNPPYNFIWQDSQGNGYPNQAGISVSNINPVLLAFSDTLGVTLTVVDSCGTTIEDNVLIEYPEYDSLGVNFGPLTENCPIDPVELDANAEGGAGELEYLWNVLEGESEFAPGSNSTDQTTFVIPSNGDNTYEVVVTDRCHRLGEDMLISVEGSEQIRTGRATFIDSVPIIRLDPLPDVITPNGDGRNDFFVIDGIDSFDNARVDVFDRWGKLVFETGNYKAATPNMRPSDGVFDAEGYEDGTYFYVINIDSGECTQSGYLQVLRSND